MQLKQFQSMQKWPKNMEKNETRDMAETRETMGKETLEAHNSILPILSNNFPILKSQLIVFFLSLSLSLCLSIYLFAAIFVDRTEPLWSCNACVHEIPINAALMKQKAASHLHINGQTIAITLYLEHELYTSVRTALKAKMVAIKLIFIFTQL